MKKRVLALALAVAMTLTSTSLPTFAKDNADSTGSAVADEVVSGSAVSASDDSVEAYEVNTDFTTAGNWQARAFGDAGGAERISGITTTKNANGDDVYCYAADALSDDSAQLRMGMPSYDDPATTDGDFVGKVASGSEGLVYYYQEVDATDDFTLSGTMKINGYNVGSNNQLSYGAMIRDYVPSENVNDAASVQKETYGNAIAVGPINLYKLVSGDGVSSFAWIRNRANSTSLITGDVTIGDKAYTDLRSSATTVPKNGDEINISITKAGSNYTLQYGSEKANLSAEDVEITGTDGKIYAGFFVSRCADVTFSNMKLKIAGAAVETGEWEFGGVGYFARIGTDAAPIEYAQFTKTDDSTIAIDSPQQGKISSSADSYSYYAIPCPSDEDFDISADVKITLNSTGNPQQATAGLIAFNSKYVDNTTNPDLPVAKMDNTFMLGSLIKGSADENGVIGVRTVTGGSTITWDLESFPDTKFPNTDPGYVVNATLRLKRSGDNIVAYVNGVKQSYDITGLFTNDNCYVGVYSTRNADIEVSNLSFVAGSRKISSIEVTKMPTKTSYIVDEKLDLSGMEVTATYEDGGKAVVDEDEITTRGFDSSKAGTTTVEVVVGAATTTIDLPVNKLKLTSLKATYTPVKVDYYTQSKFNRAGLEVVATYENGTSKTLSDDQYVLTMDGRTITDETYFTDDEVGANTVIISYAENPNHDSQGLTDSFALNVTKATLQSIRVVVFPTVKTFYVGDEFAPSGLTIQATYVDADGNYNYEILSSDEYTLEGFDSSKAQKLNMIVRSVANPSVTATFEVEVKEVQAFKAVVDTYPRMTFGVDEDYTATGLMVSRSYNNGNSESMTNSPYIYYDGTKYFTDTETVDEATAKAADYYIDLSEYDNSKIGVTKVKLVFNEGFPSISFDVAIQESTDYVWKPCIFGASSMGVDGVATSESSYIELKTASGQTKLANDVKNEIGYQVMRDGQLSDVDSVRMVSWTGAGKVSGDQDGICYYYTKVNPNNNFQLSATITVNRYIRDPQETDDFSAVQKSYDTYLAENLAAGMSQDEAEKLALDKLRSGQECFGIMARDVLPLDALTDKGDMNNITTSTLDARVQTIPEIEDYQYQRDEDGNPVLDDDGNPIKVYGNREEPINLYEAMIAGIDNVTKSKVTATFASNIVIAGGCTDSTYPTDPTNSSYYRKSIMNRINIMIRRGVAAINGGGERVGIQSTTDHLPVAGDKYDITLTKMSTGYAITTYDYQTGTTNTQYDFDAALSTSDVLTTQDEDDIWVGFFASRYADATVSNIKLYETDPTYDPSFAYKTDTVYSPKVSVESALYTTSTDYSLVLKANNPTGGLITIKQDDKIIVSGGNVTKRGSTFPVTLKPNSVTNFTIVYTPSTVDDCVSYDDVVYRFTVTHKSLASVEDDTLYCSPTGTVNGEGTREDPLDFETAVQLMGQNACHKVIMLDGTYNITQDNITISAISSGLQSLRKYLVADEGANPVIDLQGEKEGFYVAADCWNFEGITVTNAKGNGKAFYLGGQNNIIKGCTFHDNGEVGFQISRIGSDSNKENWPSYNLIQDCESYNNCDPSKNNADGFAAKLTCGYGNVFEGCVSHHNLDDGWDCYTKLSTGAIGAEVLENCISYRQGYKLLEDGSEEDFEATSGGNGFKLGGENIYVMHYLKDSLTYMNKAKGIDSNFNPAMKIRNVISYANEERNIGLYSGSSVTLKDADGSGKNAEGKVYKYDYDIKGFVSAGESNYIDQLASENYDTAYANVSATPIFNDTNYFSTIINVGGTDEAASNLAKEPEKAPKTGEALTSYSGGSYVTTTGTFTVPAVDADNNKLKDENGNQIYTTTEVSYPEFVKDSDTVALDESTFFKSTDRYDSLNEYGRYDRDENGEFIRGDFLARVDEYVHEAGDEVVLPNTGDNTTGGDTTETTTATVSGSHTSSGGGGGGGGSSRTTTTTVATTEAATEDTTATVDDDTEVTTKSAKAVVTPSGLTILPPTGDKEVGFEDIANRAWAVDAINALAKAGVINGKNATTFAPDEYCKRADFILTIVNALGLEADYTENFSDVEDGKYYANAVGIAKALGIATGYEDGTFKPEETITRQDMMVLVAKVYEALFSDDLDASTDKLDEFADAAEVSDYAVPYVAKLVNAALVNGTDKGIEPKALITRAQMAVLVKPVYDSALAYAVANAAEDEDTTDTEVEVVSEESTEETTQAKVVRGRGRSTVRVEAETETTTASSEESAE